MTRGLAVLASILLAFGGVLFDGSQRQLAAAKYATAIDSVNLRSDSSVAAAVLRVVPAGSDVRVTGGTRRGFTRVRYDGTDGWISGLYLSSNTRATVTDALNLRSGPSTGASVLTVMPDGATVGLTGDSSGQFIGVTYDGQNGWAAAAYLRAKGGTGSGGGSSGGSTFNPTESLIVTDNLNLRSGPSSSSPVLTVMQVGSRVEVSSERQNGFARIRFNGTIGWAAAEYLDDGGPAPVPREPTGHGFDPAAPGSGIAIVTEDLNLRAGPSSGQRVITVLGAGTKVQLSGSASNGFYRVRAGQRAGWVLAQYLLTPPQPDDEYGYSESLIRSFIVTAANRYGQDPDEMLRVAACESSLRPNAVNRSGSYGLFQFVASTWASTPYADNDVFEAWANANAAAWMWSQGRRNEWVCQ